MSVDRRTFLKVAATAGAVTAVSPADAAASGVSVAADGARAVLVDTTLCVGCRACEAACSEESGLPEPAMAGDERVFAGRREPGPDVFTVVNRGLRVGRDGLARYAKSQCLHCVDPACASACPVQALHKLASGPVEYRRELCIGCRYCMVACPFGVPKYEYAKTVPFVRKCDFCVRRQSRGLAPACASVCPSGALLYGDRAELLEVARTRIYQQPLRYVHQIYGEREAGGTSWLYLSDVPFESLGLVTDVRLEAYPGLTKTALAGVPFVITLLPPLLMGLSAFAKARHGEPAGVPTEDPHE